MNAVPSSTCASEEHDSGAEDEEQLLNEAVRVQWQHKEYDAVVVAIDRSRRSKPVQVQFEEEENWALGWVDEKHVHPLSEAPEDMLPAGVIVGGSIEAQDPFGKGPSKTFWHAAKLEQALLAIDGERVRFWVKFDVSGMSQWCWEQHVRECGEEGSSTSSST